MDNNVIVQNIINAAANAVREERNFSSLVQNTRNSFRRHENSLEASSRGRRKRTSFKRKVMLLKLAHADFLPGPKEQVFLAKRGLGRASFEAEIKRSWDLDKIKQYLSHMYPQRISDLLNMAGFTLAKSDKQKKITKINNIINAAQLEEAIGNGIIIIVPNKDLPSDLPIIESINVIQSSITSRSNNTSDLNARPSSIALTSDDEVSDNSTSDFIPPTIATQINNEHTTQLVNHEIMENNLPVMSNESNELCLEANLDDAICLPGLPEEAATKDIFVSRTDIFDDVLNFYKHAENNSCRVSVTFLGEAGFDLGGLAKEMFTLFWKAAIDKNYFHGENTVVPFLPIHRSKEKSNFIIMGSILGHMMAQTKCIPVQLSRTTFVLLSNIDADTINKDLLIEDFLFFVTIPERRLICKALNNFALLTENEINRLQSLFTSYNFMENPSKNKFEDQICIMAEEILINRPKNLVQKMKLGLPSFLVNMFENMNLKTINYLWKSVQPTSKKVANSLQLDNEYPTNEEVKIFFYLQNYVESLKNNEQLQRFLLFTTGSVVMPVFPIKIHFQQDRNEFARRPVAHTCSTILELPLTYASQQEFSREMDMFLNDESSFEFNII